MGPDAFDFELPSHLIAQQPAGRRADSRLLVVGPQPQQTEHKHTRDLAQLLPKDALLVVNVSKVVPARLQAERADGRSFELLLCAPAPGVEVGQRISAWVRGAKRLRAGDVLRVGASHDAATEPELALRYIEPDGVDGRARWFELVHGDVLAVCHARGSVPLPPYITRGSSETQAADRERYQTVYARDEGSVAAPTAGLHFDETLLAQIDHAKVTLHVGPGTFLPMEAEDVRDHRVGAERFEIEAADAQKIASARQQGRPIVAVGTTVTRTLESLGQGGRALLAGCGTTELVIVPGHRFEVVTHLLTNFHLPRSSLLMLVCSLGGRQRVLAAYEEAVRCDYRFYSYGDCMLVHPQGRA